MQLHLPQTLEQVAALDGRLLVLSFAPMARLKEWVSFFKKEFLVAYYEENGLGLPENIFERTRFVANPELAVYHAYELGRNRSEEVYSFKILRQYARWRKQGKPVHEPTEDPLQRGGDFVVGRDGRLTLAYSGRDQSDRPSIADILAALRPSNS